MKVVSTISMFFFSVNENLVESLVNFAQKRLLLQMSVKERATVLRVA